MVRMGQGVTAKGERSTSCRISISRPWIRPTTTKPGPGGGSAYLSDVDLRQGHPGGVVGSTGSGRVPWARPATAGGPGPTRCAGLKYEDGKPITAQDVKYGVERSFDREIFPHGATWMPDLLRTKPASKVPMPPQRRI